MPRNGNVGYSKNTPHKQDHFRRLLSTHMRIVNSIFERRPWIAPPYFYLDLNAGPGRYCVNGEWLYGSPLTACAVAQEIQLPLQAILCERGVEELATLRKELVSFGLSPVPDWDDMFHNDQTIVVTVCPGDYMASATTLLRHLVDHGGRKGHGLIYSDENGSFPPFGLLNEYAHALPYVDIVIHLAASPLKWQRVSPVHGLSQRLDELLRGVAKDYWIVRRPYGQHQWSFLIGTNWDGFPRFHRQGFWPVNSPEGASILRELSFTTKERRDHEQGNLFEGDIL